MAEFMLSSFQLKIKESYYMHSRSQINIDVLAHQINMF